MKDPAFLFYSKDFYEGTRMMLPEERACYMDLLVYQHQNGKIPLETKRVLMYCNGIDLATLEATLEAKFEQTEDGWENSRLRDEISARENYKSGQSDSGKIGQFWKKAKKFLAKKEYDKLRKAFIDKESILEFTEQNEINKNTLEGLLEGSLKHIANVNEDVNKDLNTLKITIPSENEFLDFVENWMIENKKDYQSKKTQIITKYQTWVDAGWKDGYGNPIKNWKLKFQNVEPHLRKDFNNGQSNNFKTKSNGTGLRQSVER
ncbi:YdaU family protein [Chryseobacterium sp. RP-3-3]|uniref:YdaU family protein n=1 Tax=Chryseobacterium antibioticum TaxID=2728847 RepID=A0A7Y0AMJ9_9FLAO|nr:DUF1376 domain-containing protein [Chryseobacterium antibioticum]NML69992.1 YdaU family protein [Chryseobacterium antibioticum]